MTDFISALVSGVAEGVPIFLAAAGLSLIFGVMGILNFAQGGLFMLGAFILHTLLGGSASSIPLFLLAVLGAGVVMAIVGAITERTLFLHTYRAGPHALIGVLLSFGLLLGLTGLVPLIWGQSALSQSAPKAINGRIDLFGVVMSQYTVFLLICGAVIVLAMYLLLSKSPFGKTMVAVATDRQMASALGIRTSTVSILVFAIAGGLAGIGGALIAPIASIDVNIGQSYLLFAFVAMTIGGLGSIPGTFVGAMIIGIVDSLFVNYLPELQPFAAYLAAIIVLVIRPRGLFPSSATREA
jgi:branched-chain amino acid transport system permease protein